MSQTPWRSRIVGHGEVNPHDLKLNPLNWRKHPKAQQAAMSGALESVGWVQSILVNQQTGHVLDGHLRVWLAMERNEAAVPVVYVDVSLDEERLILATLDPLAAMAEAESESLSKLLDEVSTGDAALQALLADVYAEATKGSKEKDAAVGEPHYKIAPELLERQDYLVILVESQLDWQVLCDLLGVETQVSAPVESCTLGKKGLGRVVPARVLLEKLRAAMLPEAA
jgi:ParB/Sulfiredoxin domain